MADDAVNRGLTAEEADPFVGPDTLKYFGDEVNYFGDHRCSSEFSVDILFSGRGVIYMKTDDR